MIRTRPSLALILVLAALLGPATGCSRTQWMYNYADWFLVHRMNGYFDLNPGQLSQLKPRMAKLLHWHREHELPRVVRYLEALKVRYQRGLKPQDLDWAMTQHRTFWKGFMKRGLKDFSWLLTSVKAEQIEHLRGELKQSNQEWVRQSQMTEEELQTHTLNQVLRVLEDWLGPLDPKQVDQLRAWIRPDAEWVSVKLENRRHYQKELVSLIQSHKAPEALGDRLRDWIDHPHTIRLPQYNTGLKEKQAEWKTLLLRIDRISFARQKAHFAEKLQDLIDDFRDLTNERPWFKI